MDIKEQSVKKLNDDWKEFVKIERVRWINDFHPEVVHFLKELTFENIEIYPEKDFEKFGYIYLYELDVKSVLIDIDDECEMEEIETKLTNLDEGYDQSNPWVIDGETQIDSFSERIILIGNEIIDELYECDVKEEDLQNVLKKFDLYEKVRKVADEILREEEEIEEEKMKEKFGDTLLSAHKNRENWEFVFKNGVILRGEIDIILKE